MDVIRKDVREHKEQGQAPIYNIMCALCCSTATWQSKAKDYFNAKPSFYCEEHKRLGLAFGFLEAQELSEIKK